MNVIFHGDCLNVLQTLPESSANLIVTSPPYAQQRKSSYGGIEPNKYVSWFMKRAEEFMRVLTLDGSMILNICPHTENGIVSTYVNELIWCLSETWYWKATYAWRKTNAVPGKATYRLKNAIEPTAVNMNSKCNSLRKIQLGGSPIQLQGDHHGHALSERNRWS